jgi:hypothetical protein
MKLIRDGGVRPRKQTKGSGDAGSDYRFKNFFRSRVQLVFPTDLMSYLTGIIARVQFNVVRIQLEPGRTRRNA